MFTIVYMREHVMPVNRTQALSCACNFKGYEGAVKAIMQCS